MARFDVYRYPGKIPLLLDIQADILSHLDTRVVIPLMPFHKAKKEELPRLKPVLPVNGKKYVLTTADIVTVLAARLGEKVANLEEHHMEIVDAVDFLMQGF